MPMMYLICCISFILTFWVDKILLLRYYRLSKNFSKYVYTTIRMLMPYAAVVHLMFGFVIFSYPYILNSEINLSVWGESNDISLSSYYFNAKRQGQHHMILYFCAFILVLFLVFFGKFSDRVLSLIARFFIFITCKCYRSLRNIPDPEVEQRKVAFSDDIYCEMSYDQLFKEYVAVKRERQMFNIQRMMGKYDKEKIKKYIDPYIKIVERNEKDIKARLLELADMHIDRIEDCDPSMMTQEQRIKTVLEYF